jgi:ribosome-associated heat shock protein Hsp15
MAGEQSGRVDSWIWSVRLTKTRLAASGACRGGHVRVNGVRVKPAHPVRAGDEVRLRYEGRERVVVVQRVISKRVGAPVAVECYIDNSPPPPPREEVVAVAVRDRGTGRPTKRERRSIEKLLGLLPAAARQTCRQSLRPAPRGALEPVARSRRRHSFPGKARLKREFQDASGHIASYSPVTPSRRSRSRSAWPRCRAYSLIRYR